MSAQPNFEQVLVRLEALVTRLQQPDVPLDEAVALYKQGTELAARAEKLLSSAELQVQQLTRAVQERFEGYSATESEAPRPTTSAQTGGEEQDAQAGRPG